MTYGVGAQRNISDFSDTILSRIRNKDTGEVGELLTDLMVQVKDMEIDDLDEPKGFLPVCPAWPLCKSVWPGFRPDTKVWKFKSTRSKGN